MTTTTAAPHDILATVQALSADIRASAAESERLRTLAPGIVQKFKDARLFDLILPEDFGGLGLDPIAMMRVVEQVATDDGAAGWCAGIGVGTTIVAGSVSDATGRDAFRGGNVAGGPVAPLGQLRETDGGYTLRGRWPFASGAPHCDTLIAGAFVFDGDAPRMVNGAPDWRICVMPATDVELLDTWYVSGLRGTGSTDIAVHDAFVPAERTMSFLGTRPVRPEPIYRFPIIGFLGLSIAPVPLGIARRAIEECVTLAARKVSMGAATAVRERATAQVAIAKAEAELRAARALLYEAAGDVWRTLEAGDDVSVDQRASVRLACAHATGVSVRTVETAYRLGGSTSLYETSPLQRCLRDVHATTQHIVLNENNYELAGQVLLGLTPSAML